LSTIAKRFAFHSILLTIGAILMIAAFPYLKSYGLGLWLLSFYYSCFQKFKVPSLWWVVALTVIAGVFFWMGSSHGDAFVRDPEPTWISVGIVIIWAVDIAIEFRLWRAHAKSRSEPQFPEK